MIEISVTNPQLQLASDGYHAAISGHDGAGQEIRLLVPLEALSTLEIEINRLRQQASGS